MKLKKLLKYIPDNIELCLTVKFSHPVKHIRREHIQNARCVLRRKVEKIYSDGNVLCIEVY